MATACKKRRFRNRQSLETSIDNVRKAIPLTTRYKNHWGLRIFEDWQSGRENKAVICEKNPFSLDLQNLQNLDTHLCSMTARTLNFWLIKFVQEVCDKDGVDNTAVKRLRMRELSGEEVEEHQLMMVIVHRYR